MKLLHVLAATAIALLHDDRVVVVDANAIQVALSRLPRSRDASLLLAAAERERELNASVPLTATAGGIDEQVPPLAYHEAHADAIETRIYSGEGSHTMRVTVGGQTRELIIDTGSGKTAFICEGCHKCGTAHVNAPFQFTARTEYLSCDLSDTPSVASSPLLLFSPKTWATAPHRSTCMKCIDTKCAYSQTYVEGDYWVAYKVRDEMQLASSVPTFRADIDFGCIFEQNGVFNVQSSDGIVGFSRHSDALFEQFYRRGVTKSRIFSQCLGAQGGMLTLGGVDLSINYASVQYTPIRDTGYQYWTVTLLRVSVGGAPLALDSSAYNKDRGCVFDSGTTFLYMPETVREPFKAAWRAAAGNTQYPISGAYYYLSELDVAQFPRICFLFLNDATLCMHPAMYFFRSAPGRYAGTIFFSDSAKSTIIGASALTGHNVIYDVDNARIGIAEANCEASVSSDSGTARVELSLSPGGDTFRSDAGFFRGVNVAAAVQGLLAAATLIAVAGLVNIVWTELKDTRAERASVTSAKDCERAANSGEAHKHESYAPPALLSYGGNDESEDTTSAFSFILMRDDDTE